MQFPERFAALPEYAFPRLRRLLAGSAPGGPVLSMSIGEPRHALPALIAETIAAHAAEFSRYPPNEGLPDLRGAIADWLARRYGITRDPADAILPLNGTREGLFNAALALSPENKGAARPAVLMPNPFYQAYGAAALAVGAEPIPVAATEATGFLPDYGALPRAVLDRVTLAYHDFRVLADECYSEIWRGSPPAGALEVADAMGADPERVLVFHSLSKRSGAPGLRAGFVAGGPRSIAAMTTLRAYGGAPLPVPLQHAAAALWRDEAHVAETRALYDAKVAEADALLGGMPGYRSPPAGFFLWLRVGDGEAAALRLWRETGVQVLPGAYLGREITEGPTAGPNPGREYIRVALVAERAEVARGLAAIRDCLGAGALSEGV